MEKSSSTKSNNSRGGSNFLRNSSKNYSKPFGYDSHLTFGKAYPTSNKDKK